MKFFSICLFLGMFSFLGCGKKNAEIANAYSCHVPTNNLSGCCSSHGGPKYCADPSAMTFTSDNKLVCNDEKISPSCEGIY